MSEQTGWFLLTLIAALSGLCFGMLIGHNAGRTLGIAESAHAALHDPTAKWWRKALIDAEKGEGADDQR